MTNVNNQPAKEPAREFDELLSAYVDGELTSAELAEVERRMANDPQARQFVDELRAMSGELQTLPRQTLDEDLRGIVLQRAEREMLLGGEPQTLPSRETASPRRWMWAATALAAMLLLTVLLPSAQDEDQPLASAKPALTEAVPKEQPRIEAVEPMIVAESEAMDTAGGADLETRVTARAAVSPAGESIASAGRAATVASGEGALELSEADHASDVTLQPEFLVHITLSEGEESLRQFNQLLIDNGIELEPDAPAESKLPSAGAAFADKRDRTDESQERSSLAQQELVLIEAPAKQLEDLLISFNADTQNVAAIELTSEQKVSNVPLDEWRQQVERSDKKLKQNQLGNLLRPPQNLNQTLRGKAQRLRASQYQRQFDGQRSFARELLKNQSKVSEEESEPSIQALIILHQNPTARSAPAAADTNGTPKTP